MLCLKINSKPEWIENAVKNTESILIDHAHCEKKAAGTGMSLISSYPEKFEISMTMSDLIEEEVSHFRSVVKLLNEKGISLAKDKGDPYAKELLSHVRTYEPKRMLDRLLTAGIIEARSCERLQLLGKYFEDEELKKFYTDLSASEAGHYVTFIKLAKLYFDEEEVKDRLNELAEIEKQIVLSLPNNPTVHG